MLYEMMTGELPYTAANIHAMMRAKLNEDPRPPREVLSDIDPSIEELIMHSVERSPRERYVSAKEMLEDLEDPSRVTLRDRSGKGPRPLLERIAIPRKVLVPVVLAMVVGFLLVLTWVTGHKRSPSFPAPSGPAPAASH
jgi:serine/threonine-protein kinase